MFIFLINLLLHLVISDVPQETCGPPRKKPHDIDIDNLTQNVYRIFLGYVWG